MLIKNKYGRDITNEMRIGTDGYDQRDNVHGNDRFGY